MLTDLLGRLTLIIQKRYPLHIISRAAFRIITSSSPPGWDTFLSLTIQNALPSFTSGEQLFVDPKPTRQQETETGEKQHQIPEPSRR